MGQYTNLIAYILFFLVGLLAGSFLNILIFKIPRKIPVFNPYSICSFCRNKIPILQSFPIISLILLKYRCRNCNAMISLRAISVEIINAALYVIVFYVFGFSIVTLAGIILSSVLILITFIDWDFMIIPNIIVLPFALVGLALSIAINPSKWWMPLAFSAGAFAFMLIIHLIYPKGMGMGDVKLALMLGAFLVKNVVAGLFIGFLIGSIAGLIFMIFKKKTIKQYIPFGPFLSAGGLISFFLGEYITKWYIGFF